MTSQEAIDPETGEILSDAPSANQTASQPKQNPPPTTADKNIRSFAILMSTLEGGSLNAELSKELRDLIADMNDHRAAYGGRAVNGEISISLKFKLDEGIMEIAADTKVKGPRPKRGRSILWVTPENNLSQENPQQRKFDFGANTTPIR
jgi:hypothetical protein